MIRYALLCPSDHAFDAWFRDSAAFDLQRDAGQVSCPSCGDLSVRKAVMAPAVRRSGPKRAEAAVPTTPELAQEASLPAVTDEGFQRLRAALRDMHAKLKRDAVDVGPAFPQQARAIHEGEAPQRAIYGTATDAEVRALVEDGIGVLPIPALPDERN